MSAASRAQLLLIRITRSLRWISGAALAAGAACGSDVVAPSLSPPASIGAASDMDRSAQVGTVIPKALVVNVRDAQGRPVQNASVAFAVTAGNGTVKPRVAVSNANGQAIATWTLGTVAGPNQVTASVAGVTSQVVFDAAGSAGTVDSIAFSPANARFGAAHDSLRLTAQGLDAFGNPAGPTATLEVRDPAILGIDPNGVLRARTRGSHTYVVAHAGSATDSILVTVLAPGQSPCTDTAVPLELAVGQVVTGLSGNGVCVRAASNGAEYAVVPYFDTSVPSATVSLNVRGQGVARLPLTLASANMVPAARRIVAPPPITPDYAFENALRVREHLALAARRADGRAASANLLPRPSAARVVVPTVGSFLRLNANPQDYCSVPAYRTGRIVAVTNRAIVVADTLNPSGGFTDDEYRSIGVTFDTLIHPTDSAAFGAVTDIDHNGHVILFFTHAVNELQSSPGSVVLGFFYDRDLLPKSGAPGPCSGSNQGEMFYLVVPDPDGPVAAVQDKAIVMSFTDGTIAHEYQHLINASRRLYVNHANGVAEERWLNEGLAHIAEELNFFAAAGLGPRSNLTYQLYDPKFLTAFETFERNNFLRYASYLQRAETQSPIGFADSDDDLATRGAIWSFLRYAADHVAAGHENTFWYSLVNSTTSGVANLANAIGSAPNSLFRDWAISVFMDDYASGVDPRYQQPSWNFRSALPTVTSQSFPLFTRTLRDTVTKSITLTGGGVSFLRFSVLNGQEALLTVMSGGGPAPSTVQIALVRTR